MRSIEFEKSILLPRLVAPDQRLRFTHTTMSNPAAAMSVCGRTEVAGDKKVTRRETSERSGRQSVPASGRSGVRAFRRQRLPDGREKTRTLAVLARQISIGAGGALQKQNPARPAGSGFRRRGTQGDPGTETQIQTQPCQDRSRSARAAHSGHRIRRGRRGLASGGAGREATREPKLKSRPQPATQPHESSQVPLRTRPSTPQPLPSSAPGSCSRRARCASSQDR